MPVLFLQEKFLAAPQSMAIEGQLLDGHLSLAVELLSFLSVEERQELGSKPGGMELIQVHTAMLRD